MAMVAIKEGYWINTDRIIDMGFRPLPYHEERTQYWVTIENPSGQKDEIFFDEEEGKEILNKIEKAANEPAVKVIYTTPPSGWEEK